MHYCVGVAVLSDPRAAGDSRPYESVHVNGDKVNCLQGKRNRLLFLFQFCLHQLIGTGKAINHDTVFIDRSSVTGIVRCVYSA